MHVRTVCQQEFDRSRTATHARGPCAGSKHLAPEKHLRCRVEGVHRQCAEPSPRGRAARLTPQAKGGVLERNRPPLPPMSSESLLLSLQFVACPCHFTRD